MHRDEIGLELVVGVGDDAVDQRQDLVAPPPKRSGENAADVVVVGVEIVPDHRLAAQHRADLRQARRADRFRDDLRAGPEHPDRRIETAAQLVEVGRARHVVAGEGRTILCGAQDHHRLGQLCPHMRESRIGEVRLGCREVRKDGLVRRREGRRDVVEQQHELAHPERDQLVEPALQRLELAGIRIGDIEAGRDRHHEVEPALPRGRHQLFQVGGLRGIVAFPPARPDLDVVLGPVDEAVHPRRPDPVEHFHPLRPAPGAAVETLDDPRKKHGAPSPSPWP
ncbi:MAG: hypothetical protein IPK28_16900 [Devosia sp.]|nr:hypothetical protein [Devosia sp.]